jgi:hypothetical protein
LFREEVSLLFISTFAITLGKYSCSFLIWFHFIICSLNFFLCFTNFVLCLLIFICVFLEISNIKLMQHKVIEGVNVINTYFTNPYAKVWMFCFISWNQIQFSVSISFRLSKG